MLQYKASYCNSCHTRYSNDWQSESKNITPLMKCYIVYISARSPYDHGTEFIETIFNQYLSSSWLQTITKEVGGMAHEDILEEVPLRKSQTNDRYILQTDGSHIPMKLGWEEVKTAVICRIKGIEITKEGEQKVNIDQRFYHATKDNVVSLKIDTKSIISSLGVKKKDFIVMGDGAQWIWNMYHEILPNAVQVLDYCHANAYVTEAMEIIWGEGSKEAKESSEYMRHEIKHSNDGAERVMKAIDACIDNKVICDDKKKDRIKTIREYLSRNKDRMRYKKFREMEIPIGTGLVESTQKWLIQARMKRSGMHWSQSGSREMLALQVFLANKNYVTWFKKRFGMG